MKIPSDSSPALPAAPRGTRATHGASPHAEAELKLEVVEHAIPIRWLFHKAADHIYPRARLKPLSLSSDEINHLGNFRLVRAKDNLRKRAENPDGHFTRMKKPNVPVEKHLRAEPWATNRGRLAMDVANYRISVTPRFAEVLAIAQRIVNPEVPHADR